MSSHPMIERFVASMVLGGVGDAMGYKNGGWEFCMSGEKIHGDLQKFGGVEKLHIRLPKWRVSDDTVMQLATGDGMVKHGSSTDKEAMYLKIAYYYKECMKDMGARAPGGTSSTYAYALRPQRPKGYQQPFEPHGGGCGAAMRAMCIGLRYPTEADLDDLIACAVECGRMTHHHPTGYLGSLASALFVSYSLQGKPLREWGASLMATLPKALKYIKKQGRHVKENEKAWGYFTDRWEEYLKKRDIKDGKSDPKFPEVYGVSERDEFYKHMSYSGWGGASGHDAPMIAYDALLGAGDSWEELCKRGMLHGGDNDSTGTIAGACYGAIYGFQGVPTLNYQELEYRDRLAVMGMNLYNLSHSGENIPVTVLDEMLPKVEERDSGSQTAQAKPPTDSSKGAADEFDEGTTTGTVKFSSHVEVIPTEEESSEEEEQTDKGEAPETTPEVSESTEVKSTEVIPTDDVNVAEKADKNDAKTSEDNEDEISKLIPEVTASTEVLSTDEKSTEVTATSTN